MADPLHSERVQNVQEKLRECREQLDDLELWMAAACVDQAINHLTAAND